MTLLEKYVRPAQQHIIRPLRQSTERGAAKDAIVTLKIDLAGGSSGMKSLSGSFSSVTTTYVEAYVIEQSQPL